MRVKDVRAYYASGGGPEIKAVDGVTLNVHTGEVVGIAGESGCGKSTLAAVISLTARPPLNLRGGELALDGHTLTLNAKTVAPKHWHGKIVSLIPQRAMNSLNPTARVRDFVVDVVRGHDATASPARAVEQARDRLEQLSLPPRVLDSYPHQLSGGMRQRVVAVISTLLNPKLLIADEPTSALDVSSQKQLGQLLRVLLEREFVNRIIYITHDLPMLSNFADRILIMYAGKLVEGGKTEEIVENPRHPYTQALIALTLDPDLRVRGRALLGIHGAPPDLRCPPDGCRFQPRCPQATERCVKEEPPPVGEEQRFSACWWVSERSVRSTAWEVER